VKRELDELKALLSHKIPDGDLAAVLREAVHCAIEKHGKRRGAVEPTRTRNTEAIANSAIAASSLAAPPSRPAIPAAVRRQVWKRDAGRCTFVATDGRRCGSTWKLEFDHLTPVALAGETTVDGLTLRCRAHNLLGAERAFGREFMERFRSTAARSGEFASAGES
jgi:5-methylcytosine-specific restriction endonuclease McrA